MAYRGIFLKAKCPQNRYMSSTYDTKAEVRHTVRPRQSEHLGFIENVEVQLYFTPE